MVQPQQWPIGPTQEREPLLPSSTSHDAHRSAFTDASMQQNQPSFTATDDQEEDDDQEARWFEEMRRQPWRRRPSVSWLVPWVFMHGINSALCEGPLEQLKHFVICKELLSQHNGTTGGSLLAGVDECKTETVLSIVSLLHSRIRTVTGICGMFIFFTIAPCELVFLCFATS